ncbi:hypothetical protein BABINDRAFT_56922 [Babjeviella inositovora NRRL Y-12698]|uniref:5-hydroxyisourate hydrolase n=1 Tax=Babjeviella inositovora NRRL Y-12698 TaxID=984486 RepID=A0A1E3QZ82_9ASCO|nr:uncharacterized protein BABINDRAFT_56922 [Babjeviella inositovora NRRL Y-12698]ODQ82864.1 hypothetical protein BABINDRAFT_56922 [Babjeviella inositovora NRRL Y-12698]
MSRPPITCHILDTTRGKPAADVTCSLYYLSASQSQDELNNLTTAPEPLAVGKTNGDGRIAQWVFDPKADNLALGIQGQSWSELHPGVYKIKFLTGSYFKRAGESEQSGRTFFPFVEISFVVESPPDNHYHVPLLLSNHSYSTYRGS